MFSTTTIPPSTRNPVKIVSAISERLSMLNPNRYMTPKVAIRETGTTTPGIAVVVRSRKNRNTTITTRQTEINRVTSTLLTDSLMLVLRSSTTSTLIEAATEARKERTDAYTRSTVSITLAPGWRHNSTKIARLRSE